MTDVGKMKRYEKQVTKAFWPPRRMPSWVCQHHKQDY